MDLACGGPRGRTAVGVSDHRHTGSMSVDHRVVLGVVGGLSVAAFALSRWRPSAPHRVELTYFACRGRGESLRMLLADHCPYHTNVLVEKDQWAKFKSSTPCGGLPVLRIDDYVVAQNQAIGQALGRRFGLLGSTYADHARCSMVLSMVVSDLLEIFSGILWAPTRSSSAGGPLEFASNADALIEAHLCVMEQRIARLEAIYMEMPGPFLLGGTPCVADYYVMNLACIMRECYRCEGTAPLSALHTAMLARPAVRQYLSSTAPPRARYSNSPEEKTVLRLLLASRPLRSATM